MSHELVYTSAQQGLRPGSYGFCTVMATEGMPKVLQDRLESLSGYEHAFGLTDRRSEQNPVNYSHLIVNVANQRLHLLSRIADAGADYSGRSNKLAHHVVLHPDELTVANPASTLATLGFCKTIFEGPPRWVPYGVLPSPIAHPFAICSAWEYVCKDAGWAGVLAELTLKNSGRPITLIYGLGCDVLPLVVEAMSLLPPERQWSTTFSTYFTKLPAGIECQWRFVLDGTAAADQARRNLQSPPIELNRPGRVPFETPIVEAARSGTLPREPSRKEPDSSNGKPISKRGAAAQSPDPQSAEQLDASATSLLGNVPTRRPGGFVLRSDDDLFAKKQYPVILISAIVAGIALLTISIGTGVYLASRPATPASDPSRFDRKKSTDLAGDIEKPAVLDPKRNTSKRDTKRPVAPSTTVTSQETTPSETTTNITVPVEVPINQAKIQAEIVKDIEARRRVLSLPRREQTLTSTEGSPELCKIYVKHSADCDLKLITTETLDDGQPRLFLVRVPTTDDEIQSWNVMVRHRNTTTQIIDETQIGTFTLQEQSLSFQWTTAPDWTSPFGLLYCKLEIRVGSQKLQCSLTKPAVKRVEPLDLAHRKASFPIEISANSLLSADLLHCDIELQLGTWTDSKTHVNTANHQFLKFEIPSVAKTPDTRVDLEVRIDPPAESHTAAFAYRAYVFPTFLNAVEGPRWEHITKRNDLLDEKSVEGFIVPPDSARLRKLWADNKKKAANELEKAENSVKLAQVDLAAKTKVLTSAKNAGKFDLIDQFTDDRDQAAAKLRDLSTYERYYREAVEHAAEAMAWTYAIEERFKAMEDQLQIRFTVYLEFPVDSRFEQVVLVETSPPPSNRRPGTSSGIDKAEVERKTVIPEKSQQ